MGLLSLKHAAAFAGLGAIGRNGLVYKPKCGSLLRLAAVVTNAKIPGDPIIEESCPLECNACLQACPAKAFQDDFFNKSICLSYAVRHAIYTLALRNERGRKKIEAIFNTVGYNAWIKCYECQKVYPKNQM